MAAAGGPWPILGVTFDGDADNAQFPSTHPIALLMSFLGITAGPTFDMTASTLTRLAIALARANPNNASELDLIFHGRGMSPRELSAVPCRPTTVRAPVYTIYMILAIIYI